MGKPIRVFYSTLTDRFYASAHWRDRGDGTVVITGKKYDVTQDVAAAVVEHGVTFSVAPDAPAPGGEVDDG